jgi:hypothetical protein
MENKVRIESRAASVNIEGSFFRHITLHGTTHLLFFALFFKMDSMCVLAFWKNQEKSTWIMVGGPPEGSRQYVNMGCQYYEEFESRKNQLGYVSDQSAEPIRKFLAVRGRF